MTLQAVIDETIDDFVTRGVKPAMVLMNHETRAQLIYELFDCPADGEDSKKLTRVRYRSIPVVGCTVGVEFGKVWVCDREAAMDFYDRRLTFMGKHTKQATWR